MKHLITVIAISLLLTIWSCSKKEYVTLESASAHTELSSDSSRTSSASASVDSVVLRDTFYIVERGDTVFKTSIRWRDRVRIRTDTVHSLRDRYVFVHDSIDRPIPYPVTKTVQVKTHLSAWQLFRIRAFWVLILALAAALVYIFRRPLLRLLCRLKL